MITNLRLTFIVASILALLFLMWPNVDIYISSVFYTDKDGFFWNKHPLLVALHESVRILTIIIITINIFMILVGLVKKKWFFGLSNKKLLYLLLVLVLGPGLVVNTVFKDQWGRARPYHTNEFGGTKHFTPAFIISDQCERNCSFTSGDPSVGFYFFAWSFIFSHRRRQFLLLGLTLGGIYGSVRVVQGAHFLSDVLFSGFFVYWVAYGLYHWMFETKELKN